MTATMLQVTSHHIKPWEKVWRIEDPAEGTVRYRVFNRWTWHDQRVTRTLEGTWKVDEVVRYILVGAREAAFRLKTAGPKGRLP